MATTDVTIRMEIELKDMLDRAAMLDGLQMRPWARRVLMQEAKRIIQEYNKLNPVHTPTARELKQQEITDLRDRRAALVKEDERYMDFQEKGLWLSPDELAHHDRLQHELRYVTQLLGKNHIPEMTMDDFEKKQEQIKKEYLAGIEQREVHNKAMEEKQAKEEAEIEDNSRDADIEALLQSMEDTPTKP